ncbi:3-deoxy-D-manno-octulosonate 8-phosphate phosphatase [hydrothermal vent metagenome]|uniref:3-deoxy-D-manno-octulosonate 8-phosphate phosphatase n=1 Tax=hydrothermal vent metagenome TaxID=652676 RepID=A0A3B1C0L5_9ZZZZ
MASQPKDIKLIVFDFDGVFTDNTVFVFEDGREAVRCDRSDGLGLSKLRKRGVDMMILSTEANTVVSSRARKLKLRCVQNISDKLGELTSIVAGKSIELSQVAFMGNDINDAGCLKAAGLPITTNDAHPDVKNLGAYVTKRNGGQGAVREFCDWFDKALSVNE